MPIGEGIELYCMNLQVFSDEQGYSTYQKNIQSAIR
jgi:hypothetical protein